MDVASLIRERKEDWERLEELLRRAGNDLSDLSTEEYREMFALYHRTTSDLVEVRQHRPDSVLESYLNKLSSRCNVVMHSGEPLSMPGSIAYFFREIPSVFRKRFHFFLTSFALFAGAILLGFTITLESESLARSVLPRRLVESYITEGRLWTHGIYQVAPAISSRIFTGNVTVSLVAFAGGILLGVGTVVVLVFNGLVLGSTLGMCYRYGMLAEISTFVVGHGILELLQIVAAGMAGLMIGHALVHPGMETRREKLKKIGKEAAQIVLSTVPFLLIAALVESFISPPEVRIPSLMKALIGVGLGVLYFAYIFLPGGGETEGGGADVPRPETS